MSSARIIAENLGKNLGERWALRKLDLSVAPGEVVGIIGANGAGKSTLLKVLSGLLHPDEGSYRIHGRVASLLEVGTGFHPDLSGRENAFLRGALLGISRSEVRAVLDQVAEFAGLSDRLDEPVKLYSSGMQVRLGFALSAHLPAEILMVDEVLAVGDAAFQAKSLAFLEQTWRSEGRSVLYVAHQLHSVRRICDRVLWLEGGTLRMEGAADEVCDAYLRSAESPTIVWPQAAQRRGLGHVRAESLVPEGSWTVGSDAQVTVQWTGRADGALDVRMTAERADGAALTLWSSAQTGYLLESAAEKAQLTLPNLGLSAGHYVLSVRIFINGILHDEVRSAAQVHVRPGLWHGHDYPTPRPMALQVQRWS